MTEKEEEKALIVTQNDNVFIDEYLHEEDLTQEKMEKYMRESEIYEGENDEVIKEDAERVLGKIDEINKAYLHWYEALIACIIGVVAYNGPNWLLIFQLKMRKLEMENEVMQFQTIILMLMKIERVNVEMILEWLERYSNIFRDPISKCVNNYESGAWEALEEMKNEIVFHK